MVSDIRKYPVGIQTFQRIVEENYIYIDKTDMIWRMTHVSPFVFLSRPRRFGKSLLSSTIHSYFRGDKRLFEGLKIMDLESEWDSSAVFHIDLSTAKSMDSADALRNRLTYILETFVEKYGKKATETTPGALFEGLITRAFEQTGKQVVIIIDEYDAPLLDVLHEELLLPEFRRVMQEFYQPLKACERMVRFCFITGITKFSQLSIFSTINNLTNISMDPAFSTICGITEEELINKLGQDIQMLADHIGSTYEETCSALKENYDGYHFSEFSKGVYNPYSLLRCFLHKKLDNYWFSTGTPIFIIRKMQEFGIDITGMDHIEVPSSAFDRPTEAMTDILPLLYQAGYLTIKGYDSEIFSYTLSIPNKEVKVGFTEGLLPVYTGLNSAHVQLGFAAKFWKALKKNDINLALKELQTYLEGIPFVNGFKQKLAAVSNAEGFYEYTLYLIFSMLNVYARTQVRCRGGQIDMVVFMPDTTYVFEIKKDGTAKNALEQIDSKGYALPYKTEGRKVVKAGLLFNSQTRTLKEWIVE